MNSDSNARGNTSPIPARQSASKSWVVKSLKICSLVGLAAAFAPLCAQAQNAPLPIPVKSMPSDG
jgi:hypothetical protein